MSSDLEDLKSACRASKIRSDSEIIAEGESLWLAGIAIPTEEGYLGLSMAEGHSVIFSESSILEVEKNHGHYLVRVRAGSSAVVRQEATVTLRSQSCECNGTAARTVARTNTGTGTGSAGKTTGSILVDCHITCSLEDFCEDYVDDRGYWRQICIPLLKCSTACGPY